MLPEVVSAACASIVTVSDRTFVEAAIFGVSLVDFLVPLYVPRQPKMAAANSACKGLVMQLAMPTT